MAQKHYVFGTGNLFLIPLDGSQPIPFGAIQDVGVDFKGDRKQLFGQNSYALDTSRGKVSIEGKATFGQMAPALFNAMFFGQTITTGEKLAIFNESAAVPTTPYQVTVANAATFQKDLGVVRSLTGVPLTRVASGPITGQYSVNEATGVYTFAAADAAVVMLFNYLYGSTTTGQTITGLNGLMGDIPTFQLILTNKSKGKTTTLTLNACTSSSLSFPLKQDDYAIADIDFAAQDDGTGRVFSWSFTG